jgi:hypothetical protein
MVTQPYKRARTQIHKQGSKIQDPKLPQTYLMDVGEGTRKSYLWKLYGDDFAWSTYAMRGHIHI